MVTCQAHPLGPPTGLAGAVEPACARSAYDPERQDVGNSVGGFTRPTTDRDRTGAAGSTGRTNTDRGPGTF